MKLYFRPGCTSSMKAIEWAKSNNIPIKITNIAQITKEDLIQCLLNTEYGFEEFVKDKDHVSLKAHDKILVLEQCSFNKAIEYLRRNTELFKLPIIIDKEKYLIGFNSDEIRKFLSKDYRKQDLKMKSVINF